MARMRKSAETKQQAQMIEKQRKQKPQTQLKKNDAVFKMHNKTIIVGKYSLFILSSNFKLRQALIWLIEWIWFDRLIMAVIFLNSLCLAIYDYSDREEIHPRNRFIVIAGFMFTIIFTIECVFKILALGFIIHYKAYLRDGWNWIDFIVVITGLIEQIPGVPSFRGLRTLRVLRPLRSINSIPSMKNQVASLIKSLGQLVNVLLFLLFLFIIFGILGMQVFQGRFYQRCRLTMMPDKFGNWPIDPEQIHLCAPNDSDGWYKCNQGTFCGAPQDFNLTIENENLTVASYINYGITTFDNLGVGMLTIFQSITLEGWSDLMYMVTLYHFKYVQMMDSGSPVLASVYFILLVFLGAFFLMNIILVVIITEYGNTKNEQRDREAEEAAVQIALTHDDQKNLRESYQINNHQDFNKTFKKEDKNQEVPQKSNLQSSMNKNSQNENNLKLPLNIIGEENLSQNHHSNSFLVEGNQNSSLPNIDVRPRINNTPILDLEGVISHEIVGQVIDDDEYEEFNVKRGIEIQELNLQKLELVQDEVAGRSNREGSSSDKSKIVQKFNNRTQISLREEFQESQIYSNKEKIALIDIIYECCYHFSIKGLIKRIRLLFYEIVMNQIYSNFVLSLIIMNTIILALDSYPLDAEKDAIFSKINSVLTWIFLGEMIMKLIGLGVSTYVNDRFNIFDAIVVILTIAENVVDISLSADQFTQKGAISGFRAIRLFRIFKVARNMKSFQKMIEKMALSLKDIANFSVLLFLFLFTFTLLGLELFANKVKFDKDGEVDLTNGTSRRPNFDDFVSAFITIFMVMIGDNWPQYMWVNMIAVGNASAAFFILLQIFGKYVLLNLFLAILLENFEDMDEGEPSQEETDQVAAQSLMGKLKLSIVQLVKRGQVLALPPEESIKEHLDPEKTGTRYAVGFLEKEMNSAEKSQRANESDGQTPVNQQVYSDTQKLVYETYTQFRNDNIFEGNNEEAKIEKQKSLRTAGNGSLMHEKGSLDEEDLDKDNPQFNKKKEKRRNLMETLAQPKLLLLTSEMKLNGKVAYLLGPENKLRQFFAKLVSHKYFDPFIMTLIFTSTILMAVDSPLNDPNSTLSHALNIVDIVITSFFVLESVSKIITYGFILNGPDSYLRVSWNIMDFIIVIFSLISIIFSNLKIDFIKVIRMLRVLRPLRMISRNEGLKIAVVSLINAIPQIINALVIALLFYVLFAIFGTTYFKGRFYYCLTDNISSIYETSSIKTKWDCYNGGGDWINQIMNFDNVLQSLASLFVLSSTEGWGDIMWMGVDAVDIDLNPQEGNNIAWAFFFMAFMIIGSLFMLNLFVSIVVNTYYGEKEKLFKNEHLSKYQKLWLQVQSMCFEEEPVKVEIQGGNALQQICISMARENSWFDYTILCCIILNTIFMSISWYESPPSLDKPFEYINYFFTAVFTMEAIIKLIAFGFGNYFNKGWNIFDFAIIVISYVTLIIGQTTNSHFGPKQATVARAFRIGRIFRLITKAKFLRVIFNTIIITLPSLANVGALMILLLFIFSILGVQTFALIKLQDTLNFNANFQHFGIAFLTLLRLQTGEGWNAVMMDTLRQQEVNFDCDPSPTYESIQANGGQPNGCGSAFSYLYFTLFTLIVSIIFLNLFVAVILNGFTSSNEEQGISKFKEKIQKVKEIWQDFDPQATGFIPVTKFEEFLLRVENEANTQDDNFINVILKGSPKNTKIFISHLQVPTYQKFQQYYFQDIISMLCKKYLQSKFYIEEIDKSKSIMDDNAMVQFKTEKEREFDDIIDEIQEKGAKEKIQMIEENLRMTQKYHKRMFDQVDRFEGNIYDSSYIIWVPVIQMRLRPWVKKYKERKAQAEMDRQNLEEELKNMSGGNLNKLGVDRANSKIIDMKREQADKMI